MEGASEESANSKGLMTVEEFAKMKLRLKQKKNALKKIPRIKLYPDGLKASSLDSEGQLRSQDTIVPLFLKDIQHLLVYCLYGPYFKPYNLPPRWCCVEKFNSLSRTLFIVVEGMSAVDYWNCAAGQGREFWDCRFPAMVHVINPRRVLLPPVLVGVPITDNGMIGVEALANPISRPLSSFPQAIAEDMGLFFPISQIMRRPSNVNSGDVTPRIALLLSSCQMIGDSYPVPVPGELSNKYQSYVFTKDSYAHVINSSPLFSIDCEMCLTTARRNELTRITVANESGQVVYESLVLPDNPITDYLTQYSGITAECLAAGPTRHLSQVQQDLRALLPGDAILIGHSLNMDLHALRMMHPYVIDTSVIYNIAGDRRRKPKLQTLAWEFLAEKIQQSRDGHDSVEDSLATLKLVKLKLANGYTFGDAVMNEGRHIPRGARMLPNTVPPPFCPPNNGMNSLLDRLNADNMPGHIIGDTDTLNQYGRFLANWEGCVKLTATSSHKTMRSVATTCEGKLTLVHVKPTSPTRVFRLCKNLYDAAPAHSACIILFASSPDKPTENGLCLAHVKQNVINKEI